MRLLFYTGHFKPEKICRIKQNNLIFFNADLSLNHVLFILILYLKTFALLLLVLKPSRQQIRKYINFCKGIGWNHPFFVVSLPISYFQLSAGEYALLMVEKCKFSSGLRCYFYLWLMWRCLLMLFCKINNICFTIGNSKQILWRRPVGWGRWRWVSYLTQIYYIILPMTPKLFKNKCFKICTRV